MVVEGESGLEIHAKDGEEGNGGCGAVKSQCPPTTPGPGTHIYGQGGGREGCEKVDLEVNEEMADAELCVGVNALHHPCVSPAHRLAQLHHQRARENQLTLYTRSAATHCCQTQSTFYSTS